MMPVPLPLATEADRKAARLMAVWGQVPVYSSLDWIPVQNLVATQPEVSEHRVLELSGVHNPGPIDVALIGERYIIVEGHHRATVAVQRGHSSILASIRSLTPAPPGGAT